MILHKSLNAKIDLLDLAEWLETNPEGVIFLERDGVPIVEMRLAQKKPPVKQKPDAKRIGVARGRLHVPDDFDKWGLL